MDYEKTIFLTDKLSIGNIKKENEHYNLIEIINDLDELIEYKKNRQEFAKILTKMTDYSLNHFKTEEASMKKMSYPLLDEHKNHHRDYIYRVAMYNINLLNNYPPDPKDIIVFLKNWWINHILTHDAKYEKYKKEI